VAPAELATWLVEQGFSADLTVMECLSARSTAQL
jgi:hypothetical protein